MPGLTRFENLAAQFPDVRKAPLIDMPLAFGGGLDPLSLVAAYSKGLFPWFEEGDPVLWWSLHPRCVLFPDKFHLPRRSRRQLKKAGFTLTINQRFRDVMEACAAPRKGQSGTWITPDMLRAYQRLHELGYAHSFETWHEGRLAGALYGVALGKVFFGESMFHLEPEASRAALLCLVETLKKDGFHFLDCQQESPHMTAAGAVMLHRLDFFKRLQAGLAVSARREYAFCPWEPWRPQDLHGDVISLINLLPNGDKGDFEYGRH